MKNFLFLCLMICSFSLLGQNINLKMPSTFYYEKSPAQGKRIKLTVKTKLDAINLIHTDNQNSKKLAKNSIDRGKGKGKPSFLLAIPKLYNVSSEDGVNVYRFGKNGGEDDEDDATVRVSFDNAAASTPLNENNKPIIFKVAKSAMYKASKSNETAYDTQDYLEVEASKDNRATIQINRNSKQGNTIVAIFDNKNGKLLGTLNPKDPDNPAATLSFTTDQSVYVVPVIRPKVTRANGKDKIIFEVGDPRENGNVESEDE